MCQHGKHFMTSAACIQESHDAVGVLCVETLEGKDLNCWVVPTNSAAASQCLQQ